LRWGPVEREVAVGRDGGAVRVAGKHCQAGSHGLFPWGGGGGRVQEAFGGLVVASHVVGDDRDLASVEEALADAVVVADMLEGLGPLSCPGEGSCAVCEEHGP
jgi:hypothetical protein